MSTMETVKTIDPRVKSAVLWGAVGFMSFLVLIQGYALYDGPLLSLAQGAAIGLLVGVAAGGSAYALEHRVAEWAARRAEESDGGGRVEADAEE